jgi:hypothetical protein
MTPAATLTISEDGTKAEGLVTDVFDFEALGIVGERRRVSHIWPAGKRRRALFRWLRHRFGDRGFIALLTRLIPGSWTVRLSDDPDTIRFTHRSRRACLAWEREYFNSL